jgi:hypothetical protein
MKGKALQFSPGASAQCYTGRYPLCGDCATNMPDGGEIEEYKRREKRVPRRKKLYTGKKSGQ